MPIQTPCFQDSNDSFFATQMLLDDCSSDVSKKSDESEDCSNRSGPVALSDTLDADIFELEFEVEDNFLIDVERMLPVSLSPAIRSPLRSVRPEGKR
jgi:hypothetical protein